MRNLFNRVEKIESKLRVNAQLPEIIFFEVIENSSAEIKTGYKAIATGNGDYDLFENGEKLNPKDLRKSVIFIEDITE